MAWRTPRGIRMDATVMRQLKLPEGFLVWGSIAVITFVLLGLWGWYIWG
jgi:hypothetical protein